MDNGDDDDDDDGYWMDVDSDLIETIQNEPFVNETYPNAKFYNFNKERYIETAGEKCSRKLLSLATKHSVPQAFFDEAIGEFNNYIQDRLESLRSYHLSKKVSVVGYTYINLIFIAFLTVLIILL